MQGGLVTAVLDAAMGNACWTALDHDQVFLTADLKVEFLRPTQLAASRCTQSVLPAGGSSSYIKLSS